MEQAKINEYRQLAEAHKKERRSAHIILECLTEIERLQGLLKRKEKRSKFQPPNLKEVTDYGYEIGIGQTDRAMFLDYFTAREWKSGKSKIVDWKAAMRNWKRNIDKFGKGDPKNNGKDPTRWREFLCYKKSDYQQHRFAPEYLRLEFSRWLKGK